VKRFTTGSKTYLKDFSKAADDAGAGAEMAETTGKRLLCCGFPRTGKLLDKCIVTCMGSVSLSVTSDMSHVRVSVTINSGHLDF
jgi:hypothetical protein